MFKRYFDLSPSTSDQGLHQPSFGILAEAVFIIACIAAAGALLPVTRALTGLKTRKHD